MLNLFQLRSSIQVMTSSEAIAMTAPVVMTDAGMQHVSSKHKSLVNPHSIFLGKTIEEPL